MGPRSLLSNGFCHCLSWAQISCWDVPIVMGQAPSKVHWEGRGPRQSCSDVAAHSGEIFGLLRVSQGWLGTFQLLAHVRSCKSRLFVCPGGNVPSSTLHERMLLGSRRLNLKDLMAAGRGGLAQQPWQGLRKANSWWHILALQCQARTDSFSVSSN